MNDEWVLVPEKLIAKLSCELEHGEPTDWCSAGREVVNSATKPPEVEQPDDLTIAYMAGAYDQRAKMRESVALDVGKVREIIESYSEVLFDLYSVEVSAIPVSDVQGIAEEIAALVGGEQKPISCSERLPKLGQKVVVEINGVVQEETFTLDQEDDGFSGGGYFWSRDDVDDCPLVDFESDRWWPLPTGLKRPQEG